MERYSEYKDSGVKWLGEIPSHWEPSRNKAIFRETKAVVGKNSKKFTLLSLTKKGVIVRNLDDGGKFPAEFDTYKIVEPGDFIFCFFDVDETPRAIGLATNKGMITGAYTVLKQNTANSRYLYYYYLSIDNAKALKPLYSGLRKTVPLTSFMSMQIFLPPREEQDAIVSYLDAATSKIDKAIAMQQKMIDLLNERKQIIIQNAVTKGLDENVEMKDSGVEWIGMIPKHWEIEPFGKHFTFGKGLPITKANLQEEGVAVISYGQVHAKYNLGTTLTETLVRYVSPKYLETHPQCLLNKNDFIFADTSEDVEGSGNFAFNDYKDKIFAGYHTVVARPKDLIYPKYYAYLFKSRAWKSQIQSLVNGVKVYSIGKRILKTSTLLIPCESEQKEIVKVLDLKTAAIEKSIENISRQIALLQERKQIIINEVVTGKVKVS